MPIDKSKTYSYNVINILIITWRLEGDIMKTIDEYQDKNGLSEKEFLQSYNPSAFERLSLSVDAVIFSIDTESQTKNYRKLDDQRLTVLLVKRNEHPFIGKWSLPGGFVGMQETLDEAAIRIIKNKTGLDDLYMEQLYTYGNPDRDPRMRIISCTYLSLVDRSKFELLQSPLVTESAWFEVETKESKLILSRADERIEVAFEKKETRNGKIKSMEYKTVGSSELAFDHGTLLLDGLMRLRHKVDYTDIVFNLLPEEFSITQLQQIYEIILGQKLLAPAFRRKILPKIQETGKYSQEKGHRPSQFFVYREEEE